MYQVFISELWKIFLSIVSTIYKIIFSQHINLQLTFLEDPHPGDEAFTILVSKSAAKDLDMTCRGGEHCCQRDSKRICDEGEGDCNSDWECKGMLECGQNNCKMEGGLWDAEDDCCQRRCTFDRTCGQGQVKQKTRKKKKQAEAELGQAQPKLRFRLNLKDFYNW